MRITPALLVAWLVSPLPSWAADDVACWYRDLERLDHVTDPPQGGDNQFFTRSDVPPNLLWVLDTSGSMQTMPCNGDCGDFSACNGGFHQRGNTFFTMRGYKGYTSDAAAYPAFDADHCTAGNPTSYTGKDGCYRPGLVYAHTDESCGTWPNNAPVWNAVSSTSTPQNWCSGHYRSPTPPLNSCSSHGQCASGFLCLTSSGSTSGSGRRCRLPNNCTSPPVSGWSCPGSSTCNASTRACEDTAAVTACVTQLETFGYHPNPEGDKDKPYFMGDALNFYPPKFVVARKVLKDLVLGSRKMRQGLMTFDRSDTFGGNLDVDFNPECNMFFPPKDSNFDNNRKAVANRIDNITFLSGTPLGETLTSACQYISGNRSRFENQVKVKGSTGVGFSDPDIPNKSNNQDTVCVSCQRNFIAVITDGFPSADEGVPCRLKNYDGDCKEGLRPTPSCSNASSSQCSSSEERTYPAGSYDFLDDVAAFCHEEDLRPDLPGKQNAVVHTVGFDIRAPILEDAARQGGGLHFAADDAQQLRTALTAIVSDVNKRATSFSVASVTTVQTRGTTYAFVPRFRPAAEDLWEGHLYRFKLFNEFSAGCTPGDTTAPFTADKLKRNPNKDGDCSDVYLLDGNDDYVGENDDGAYVVLDTSKDWEEGKGWPAKSPVKLAKPVWDAAEELTKRDEINDPRSIWTVVDSDGDGVLEPSERIAFTTLNAASLVKALALGGVSGKTCSELAARTGSTYANETACAMDLIKFVRGRDVFDEDGDGNRNEARPKILADIFHSSPILVTPPAPPFLCDLGLITQCSFSLYSSQLTPNGMAAYADFEQAQAARPQFVLVGSNDGMLHAIHAGAQRTGDDPETPQVEGATNKYFDLGTGHELWAFIPPDLLPKLKRLVVTDGRHELLLDGTAMVRDVWVESSTEGGRKNGSEFHTVAVVGERQGGRSYFALDVTDATTPGFLWSFPPPGSPWGLEAGESWNDVAPSAPPIGPVAIAKAGGPVSVNETAAEEVWAVFLSGGWDPNLVRGRAVHALNVWTGKPLWRFAASDATGSGDPRASLFPVASPVSMLDLGATSTTRGVQDGFFDSAVFGDVMGQVWTLRFHEPGEDTNGDGLMDNWFGARAFAQFDGEALAKRSPFFQLAEATIAPDTGAVRVHLGSGDRAQIRQPDGGECSLMNMQACVRKQCDVNVSAASASVGATSASGTWRHQISSAALTSVTATKADSASDLACNAPLAANMNVAFNCGGSSTGSWSWGLSCDWGTPDCATETFKPDPTSSALTVARAVTPGRFYSFQLWGPDSARTPFTDASSALAYDQARLSDDDLGNADGAGATNNGWYVPFSHQDERTASSAAVLGGCVVWDTLVPDVSTVACGAKVADTARSYHAQFASGTTQCGSIEAGPRYFESVALVPPAPPNPTVSYNERTGETEYSMLRVPPGSPPMKQRASGGELAGPIYWLEVPREVHACRHGTGKCE